MRHVSVQNATSMRYPVMDPPVDEQSRRFNFAIPFNHLTLSIRQQQMTSRHFLPVHSDWIHQKMLVVYRVRVVVTNTFTETKLRRPAKDGREIAASFCVTRHEMAVRNRSCIGRLLQRQRTSLRRLFVLISSQIRWCPAVEQVTVHQSRLWSNRLPQCK